MALWLGAPLWAKVLIIVVVIWEGIWKGIALWRAARNGHLIWFIAMIVVNSVGILPIIYILVFSKRKKAATPVA